MKSIHTLLSFVIPCYRSEETITKVIEEIINVVSQRPAYDYEIICVNDFSPDDVYQVLQELAVSNSKIKVVNLAQNVGKHGAILAGYSFAKGEFIVNIDDDLLSGKRQQISALSERLKELRKEVRLCDGIAERSGVMRENLNAVLADEEKIKNNRKENRDYEHRR